MSATDSLCPRLTPEFRSCRQFDFYADELYAGDDLGIACSTTADQHCEQHVCEMPQQPFSSDKQGTPCLQLMVDDQQFLIADTSL